MALFKQKDLSIGDVVAVGRELKVVKIRGIWYAGFGTRRAKFVGRHLKTGRDVRFTAAKVRARILKADGTFGEQASGVTASQTWFLIATALKEKSDG